MVDKMDRDQYEERLTQFIREDKYRRREILIQDEQFIQWVVWDFQKAYENQDMQRMNNILEILINYSNTKDDLDTLQQYFQGKPIARYKNTIHVHRASEWVSYIGSKIREMQYEGIDYEPVS